MAAAGAAWPAALLSAGPPPSLSSPTSHAPSALAATVELGARLPLAVAHGGGAVGATDEDEEEGRLPGAMDLEDTAADGEGRRVLKRPLLADEAVEPSVLRSFRYKTLPRTRALEAEKRRMNALPEKEHEWPVQQASATTSAASGHTSAASVGTGPSSSAAVAGSSGVPAVSLPPTSQPLCPLPPLLLPDPFLPGAQLVEGTPWAKAVHAVQWGVVLMECGGRVGEAVTLCDREGWRVPAWARRKAQRRQEEKQRRKERRRARREAAAAAAGERGQQQEEEGEEAGRVRASAGAGIGAGAGAGGGRKRGRTHQTPALASTTASSSTAAASTTSALSHLSLHGRPLHAQPACSGVPPCSLWRRLWCTGTVLAGDTLSLHYPVRLPGWKSLTLPSKGVAKAQGVDMRGMSPAACALVGSCTVTAPCMPLPLSQASQGGLAGAGDDDGDGEQIDASQLPLGGVVDSDTGAVYPSPLAWAQAKIHAFVCHPLVLLLGLGQTAMGRALEAAGVNPPTLLQYMLLQHADVGQGMRGAGRAGKGKRGPPKGSSGGKKGRKQGRGAGEREEDEEEEEDSSESDSDSDSEGDGQVRGRRHGTGAGGSKGAATAALGAGVPLWELDALLSSSLSSSALSPASPGLGLHASLARAQLLHMGVLGHWMSHSSRLGGTPAGEVVVGGMPPLYPLPSHAHAGSVGLPALWQPGRGTGAGEEEEVLDAAMGDATGVGGGDTGGSSGGPHVPPLSPTLSGAALAAAALHPPSLAAYAQLAHAVTHWHEGQGARIMAAARVDPHLAKQVSRLQPECDAVWCDLLYYGWLLPGMAVTLPCHLPAPLAPGWGREAHVTDLGLLEARVHGQEGPLYFSGPTAWLQAMIDASLAHAQAQAPVHSVAAGRAWSAAVEALTRQAGTGGHSSLASALLLSNLPLPWEVLASPSASSSSSVLSEVLHSSMGMGAKGAKGSTPAAWVHSLTAATPSLGEMHAAMRSVLCLE